jgi:hypothetical protein
MSALSMHEAILDKYSQASCPATHNSSNQHQPIDGLFGMPGLKAVAARYASFTFWSCVIRQDVCMNSTQTFIPGSVAFNQGSAAAN